MARSHQRSRDVVLQCRWVSMTRAPRKIVTTLHDILQAPQQPRMKGGVDIYTNPTVKHLPDEAKIVATLRQLGLDWQLQRLELFRFVAIDLISIQ